LIEMASGLGYIRQKQLYQAARTNNIEVIKELLKDPHLDLNYRLNKQEGLTPLWVACLLGHIETVQLLIADERTDVDAQTCDGRSPLCLVCDRQKLDLIKLLLADPRVHVNLRTDTGKTAVYLAAQEGRMEVLKLLMAHPDINIHIKNNDGVSPFMSACQTGEIETIKMFLAPKSGVDPKAMYITGEQIDEGRMAAEEYDQGEMAEYLSRPLKNPMEFIAQLRVELDILDCSSAIFALFVLISDGYLTFAQNKTDTIPSEKVRRQTEFLKIGSKLPAELQMILAKRCYGSNLVIIKSEDFEKTWKRLLDDL